MNIIIDMDNYELIHKTGSSIRKITAHPAVSCRTDERG